MTPVAKTGLHCGVISEVAAGQSVEVTPVAKTGLHCGEASRYRFPDGRDG